MSRLHHVMALPRDCVTKLVLGKGFGALVKVVAPDLAYKGVGKFVNRPTTTGGKKYDKYFVYVPTAVARDSQFPFKTGDVVKVRIDLQNKRVVLEQ
jgi:hypothetical protein